MNTQEQIAQQIEAQTAVLGQSIQGLVNRCEVRQDRASKFYDRDESINDLRYELENAMSNGLAGRVQFVPTYSVLGRAQVKHLPDGASLARAHLQRLLAALCQRDRRSAGDLMREFFIDRAQDVAFLACAYAAMSVLASLILAVRGA